MKETIRTTGDLRRNLAQAMVDMRSGNISFKQGLAMAKEANKITASLNAKVKRHGETLKK